MDRRLDRLRTLSRVLDDLLRIPGTPIRVGLDSVIGLIPGAGDAVGGVLATYALLVGVRLGAPRAVLARMGANILIDVALGALPLVGDVADIGWKANRRNLRLLEAWAERPAAVRDRSRTVLIATAAGLAAAVLLLGAAVVWGVAAVLGALT